MELTSEVKKRLGILILVIVVSLIFLVPTVLRDSAPESWVSKKIGLGLDLVGGVHLVYEVEVLEAVKNRLQVTASAIKSDAKKEKIAITRVQVTDNYQVEFSLLSERLVEKLKGIIEKDYKEISYRDTVFDGTRPKLVYGIDEIKARKIEQEAVLQAIETLRNRVDQFGVAEPLIQKAGLTRIILQMPGVSDIESVKKVVGSVAKLEFRLVASPGASAVNTITLKDREGTELKLEDEVLMTGDAVDDARMAILNGQVEVSLSMTGEGSKTFKRITTAHTHRQLAIILDNVVYSAPNIREPISGGRASISGGFQVPEAQQLAVVLRADALPAPLHVLEERTVGPTLGKESIEKGLFAMVAGSVCVFLFMFLYYRKSGVVAVGTLLLNVILMVSALAGFGATLTLPGLAGLALTVGMAVDANVLIFERIREELRNGSTRDAAVRSGYEKAFSAIVDSNITTFLTAMILLYFGSGPIRGFAITLGIGILSTLFCATFVGRLIFDLLPLRGGAKELSI